jgi:recombination protein RecT
MSEQSITQYMRNDLVKSRFAEVVGDRNAGAYIASVLLAVANDQSGLLRQASPESIYISALRAASLRLSVDPSTGQAYLVPFRNKGTMTATLIIGYKGLYDMAIRTGRYRYINVGKVYEGEIAEEDRISGFHRLEGRRTGNAIIGWIGAFEMTNGYGKTIYMTIEEIHAHAKRYSKSYTNSGSLWQCDPKVMERKTVLRMLLRRWGYLDPADVAVIDSVDEDNQGIELETVDIETGEIHTPEPRNEEQLMNDLGYGDGTLFSDPAQAE